MSSPPIGRKLVDEPITIHCVFTSSWINSPVNQVRVLRVEPTWRQILKKIFKKKSTTKNCHYWFTATLNYIFYILIKIKKLKIKIASDHACRKHRPPPPRVKDYSPISIRKIWGFICADTGTVIYKRKAAWYSDLSCLCGSKVTASWSPTKPSYVSCHFQR